MPKQVHRFDLSSLQFTAVVCGRSPKRQRKLSASCQRLLASIDRLRVGKDEIVLDETNMSEFLARFDDLLNVLIRARASGHTVPGEETE